MNFIGIVFLEGESIGDLIDMTQKDDFFEYEFKRTWNNFQFSFLIYRSDRKYLKQLCIESIERIEYLYRNYLKLYGVSCSGYRRSYTKRIMDIYKKL